MIELTEGQLEVGGIFFGDDWSDAISILEVDMGSAEWTTQDVNNPAGSNRFFGRDQVHGPTWTLTILINRDNAVQARQSYNALVAAWRTAGDPETPGATTTLRYGIGGVTRRVYGRPRNIAPGDTSGISQGVMEVVAQFVTEDPFSYQDEVESVTVMAISGSSGGLQSPLQSPLTSTASTTRQGLLHNSGDAPTPFKVVFKGPSSASELSGAGWKIALDTVIPYDQWITVDTRRGTAIRSTGATASGAVRFGTYIGEARIQPGDNEIAYKAIDVTGTASAEVTFHPAAYGI